MSDVTCAQHMLNGKTKEKNALVLSKKKTVCNKRIRIAKHPLEIHLLFAVWTSLLLSHYTPTTNAELME